MRGDVHQLDLGDIVGFVVLQDDAFSDFDTRTGVLVTASDPGVGRPAAEAIDLDGRRVWIRPTQVHTLSGSDLGAVVGAVDAVTLHRVLGTIGTLLAAR